jgi:hypothetical protein
MAPRMAPTFRTVDRWRARSARQVVARAPPMVTSSSSAATWTRPTPATTALPMSPMTKAYASDSGRTQSPDLLPQPGQYSQASRVPNRGSCHHPPQLTRANGARSDCPVGADSGTAEDLGEKARYTRANPPSRKNVPRSFLIRCDVRRLKLRRRRLVREVKTPAGAGDRRRVRTRTRREP